METLKSTFFYFFTMFFELTILFLAISTLVALILMYLPKEKTRLWMTRKGIIGNIIAAIIGALTPFCACSTIPMTLGFLEIGVPFGSVITFIIASPLLNPIIIGMLFSLMGWKVGLIYFTVVFLSAIFFGILFEKLNFSRYIKIIRFKPKNTSNVLIQNEPFFLKLKKSFLKAFEDYKSVFKFLVIGVALGSIIYGFIPEEFILKYAGTENWFAVPISAIIGVPLLVRVESAIAIGLALMQKGMSVGAVIAFIIGGAGMAIPEMSLLAGIFKKKLVIAIILIIFMTATFAGFFFNFISINL
jgi:hypothetical protein